MKPLDLRDQMPIINTTNMERRRIAVGISLLTEHLPSFSLTLALKRLDRLLKEALPFEPLYLLPKETAEEVEFPVSYVEEGFVGFLTEAKRMRSDLVVLAPGLLRDEGTLIDALKALSEPLIEGGTSLCIGVSETAPLENPLAVFLLYPLLSSLFSVRIPDPLPSSFSVSGEVLLGISDPSRYGHFASPFQLILEVLALGRPILLVPLPSGSSLRVTEPPVIRKVIKTAFGEVRFRERLWMKRVNLPLETPPVARNYPGGIGPSFEPPDPKPYLRRFQKGLNAFSPLFGRFIPEVFEELKPEGDRKELRGERWARALYGLMQYLHDPGPFGLGDLFNAFTVLFYGRLYSLLERMRSWRGLVKESAEADRALLALLEGERRDDERAFLALVDEFVRGRYRKPPLPKVTYREYVPGIPLVFPHHLREVPLEEVFKDLLEERRRDFWRFAKERLGLGEGESSREIASSFRDLLEETEKALRKSLGGNFWEREGLQEFLNNFLDRFPVGRVFCLGDDASGWFLERFPPPKLLSLASSLKAHSPRELLALTQYTEGSEYWENLKNHLREDLRPDQFREEKPRVMVLEGLPVLRETVLELETVDKLSGVLILRELPRGLGGRFPWLGYTLLVAKNLVEMEFFGRLWRWASRRRKEFGRSVIGAIEGHWGRDSLSGHSFFEAMVHEETLKRLKTLAVDPLGQLLEGYPLCLQFPDGRFVSLSAWSWAIHSLEGGKGNPGPLSSMVEAQMFARDFLLRVSHEAGLKDEEVERVLGEMQLEGRESQSLLEELFPEASEAREVKPKGPLFIQGPLAGKLQRHPSNPLLRPIPEHPWESRFVFNPAAIRINQNVYLLYRAMGDDWISRIGLAVLDDTGVRLSERLPEPIFWPQEPWEELGCEDPRVVLIDGRLWMLYTAYSRAVAQIALASIDLEDFLRGRWDKWVRHGLVFPGEPNKDAILFPERVDGKFVLIHRVEPSMWISFSENLTCPWTSREHKILIGPRSGDMWDSLKIGAGGQPLKTRYGWFLIYHGVDRHSVYRLGSLLLDLEDPTKVLYRSPNPILEPEEPYERGEEGAQVPNVVFTCGNVPRQEKEILEPADEVLVYYGAADTVIGLALGKVKDLVPWPHGIERWFG